MARELADAAEGTSARLAERESLIRMIKDWEAGRHKPKDPYRILYSRVLGIDEDELFSEETLAASPDVSADQSMGPRGPLPMLVTESVPVSPPTKGDPGRQSADMTAMKAFRTADLQVGGGHLYASVVKYLETDLAPRLFGVNSDESDTLFMAATALTEMAGWMAHDSGRDLLAEQHFDRALALTKAANDQHLTAHILSSKSHLASYLRNADKAILLARKGQDILRVSPNGILSARLFAMEARGFAGLGKTAECFRLLERAEKALEGGSVDETSLWVSNFDAGSLASEAARCMSQLGKPVETRRYAERIISLRPAHRTRSRAFGQLTLASACIHLGKFDEACAVTQEVLTSTQSLGSFLIIKQLNNLRLALTSSIAVNSKAARELSAHLEAVVEERLWLYQWLSKDEKRQVGSTREL
ncbi:hypothetical protein [Sphaerisporangium album]|uniref:hypothetical protein n=1 Tax=Sphaerisporangium album TaxID=509200 RepID=UPI0011C03A85|nr:hypothetical protein [Sphaerisporangium album]